MGEGVFLLDRKKKAIENKKTALIRYICQNKKGNVDTNNGLVFVY
jgi:hypothetical protein